MNKEAFIKTLIGMGGCGAKPETWDKGWGDAIGEVIKIAEELDEPEKPVIPQFIADYLPLVKEDIELEKASYYAVTYNELPKWKREYDWIRENFETFVKAWLAYPNIEVEEEQKYNVKIAERDFMVMDDDGVMYPTDINIPKYKYQFTEQEIKDYDERLWPFAVKAEELKE